MKNEKICAKSAKTILDQLLIIDDVESFVKTLDELFMQWVRSDFDYFKEDRCTISNHYLVLKDFLADADIYDKAQRIAT